MGYRMTEEQVELRDMVRSWLEHEVKPRVRELDEKGECPLDLVQQGFDMGLHMLEIPKEYGGAGLDARTACIVHEEINRIDGGLAVCFSITAMAVKCILDAGNEEQKRRACNIIAQGKFASFCLTEPQGGSDAANILMTATRDGDNYVLNGRKCFITNAPHAELFVVYAATDKSKGAKGISAFMVERNTPGLSVGKDEDKMSSRLSATSDVIFDNVVVPKENLIGREGMGFIAAMKTLDAGRVSVAAGSVGVAQRAMEEAVAYAKIRTTFGKPICEHQVIQAMIADMSMQIEAARQLCEYALDLMEAGKPYSKAVAMAKCFAADTAVKVATDAVQIFGGYGVCRDYPVEKLYRDAKLGQIVEGSQQIQRMIIGRAVVSEDGKADYITMQQNI